MSSSRSYAESVDLKVHFLYQQYLVRCFPFVLTLGKERQEKDEEMIPTPEHEGTK